MNQLMNFRIRKTVTILVAMFGLATLSFNCAPSLFQTMDYSYLASGKVDDEFSTKLSPWVLQNTGQVLETMASVTGFSQNISGNQRAEYDARTGSLSQTDKVSDINAPLQMGSTSLAGEFCNGVIARESANGAARKFFVGVNFGAGIATNSAASYQASIDVMAQSFWGRDLTDEEALILTDYYNDFVATAGTAAAQTRNLYLSTCSAMLASFDALTY